MAEPRPFRPDQPYGSDATRRRNILAYAIPELFWGCAWTLAIDNPLPAAFAKSFGGSEGFVGLFAVCVSVGLGLPMLFSDYVASPFRRKAGFLFWGHIVPALTVVGLGLATGLLAGADDGWVRGTYLVGYVLFFLAIGFQIPLWFGLVGDLFPPGMRARVLAIAFAFNRIGALVGGAVAESLLAASWTPHDKWALIFGIAGTLMLIGCLPFRYLVEPRRRPRRRPPLGTYLRGLVDTWRALPGLRRFVLADLLGVFVFVVMFFYGDAAIRAHGAHESWAGAWVTTYALTQLPLSILISWVGDRLSPRAWMAIGGVLAASAAVTASVVTEPAWFHLVAALLGAYMLIRMTCHSPQVMKLAGDRDATIPIALAWVLVVPLQGLGPFIAGSWVIPETGYPPVFLFCAICSVVCGIAWWRHRRDDAGNPDSSPA